MEGRKGGPYGRIPVIATWMNRTYGEPDLIVLIVIDNKVKSFQAMGVLGNIYSTEEGQKRLIVVNSMKRMIQKIHYSIFQGGR